VLRFTMFLVVVMTAKADSGSETECCTSDLNLRDKENADFFSQLINDPIAWTFSFLNVAVFDADFENGVGRARNLIARTVTTFKVIKQWLQISPNIAIPFG
jgi:hypothetical protein